MKTFAHAAFAFICGVLLIAWHTNAEAARQFTLAQITSPADFAMGTAATVTFRVTNTSTAGESMNRVRFYVSATYTVFPNQVIAPPAGFTSCTLGNATTIGGTTYYRRISCTGSLASGANRDFRFNVLSYPTGLSTDRNDALSNATARFTGSGTNYGPSNAGWQGGWTWKALLVLIVPSVANAGQGCPFSLTMTVTNRSTANGVTISPVPSLPTRTYTGGATVTNNSGPTPASLTLNSGITGTFVWTWTMNGSAPGTVTFTACASTGGNCTSVSGTSRTSSSITSAPVNIIAGAACNLTAALASTPTCLYSGDVATFRMTVTNTTGGTVNNVTPSALTCSGAATIGSPACTFASGPSPGTVASLASGSSCTFTWTATVTGAANDTYAVTGTASANAGALVTAPGTSPSQDVDGYVVTVSPPSTTAQSANEELVWTVTNQACSNIAQVTIAVPAGWTFADEGYALVTTTTGTQADTWTRAAGTTTFVSPNAGDRIPPAPSSGEFSLLFSATPATPGVYTFNLSITDDAATPVTRIVPSAVTVNPFDSTGPNATGTMLWREEIR